MMSPPSTLFVLLLLLYKTSGDFPVSFTVDMLLGFVLERCKKLQINTVTNYTEGSMEWAVNY